MTTILLCDHGAEIKRVPATDLAAHVQRYHPSAYPPKIIGSESE
jgi:hypothetical protein